MNSDLDERHGTPAPGVDSESPSNEKRARSPPSRRRRSPPLRRSRSRERRRRRSHSRSRSPRPFRGGGFRGNRRSPFRGQRRFNDRRSRSRSRNNNRFNNRQVRRFDRTRRSRSESPSVENYTMDVQPAAPNMYTDGYGNYVPNVPVPQQFGTIPQFNSYDFQEASTFQSAMPVFNVHGISCPAPPGMTEGWIAQSDEKEEETLKRKAAVAEEKKRQREGLKKQRDQYVSRSEKMKRELKDLKQQKSDLTGHGKRSPSPKTNGFIKENEKLQSQISSKLSEILNVIEMLNGIIGEDPEDEQSSRKTTRHKSIKQSQSDSSPERIKTELLESMKKRKLVKGENKQNINLVVYDPEVHWCKTCQVFPKTAEDYLVHLHTKEHAEKTASKSLANAPWRESFQKTNDVPNYPDAPTKQIPIQGLQFFEPATAWFCKLCEMFVGDTWCASIHWKSQLHTEKYSKFIEREPMFEEKWLEARTKAFEIFKNNGKLVVDNDKTKDDKKVKKKKSKHDGRKDKKKKNRVKKRKRGSTNSSSSESDHSELSSDSNESTKKDNDLNKTKNSIRVTMRNILKDPPSKNDEKTGKWTMVAADADKPVPPPAPSISKKTTKENQRDDQIIGQWSTLEPIISQEEKRLLENLKGRLKTQQSELAEKPVIVNRHEDQREKLVERNREKKTRENSRERARRDRHSRGRRSPSRNRRSHSRGRRSHSRNRRSRTRSRSRSRGYRRYSRSRSNSRRRVERPIVNFPEPRLPPNRDDKKLPARSYVISKKEDNTNSKKVMPIIGKMPVFKKQLSDKKSEEMVEESVETDTPVDTKNGEKLPREDTWDDYMPDPLQFSALMGAPPPPPRAPEEPEIVPPGLNPEEDFEFIPKPINDAPIARKGPLPKDFQDTLDLLYDGDTPKPVVEPKFVPEPVPLEPPIALSAEDGPQMINAEDLSQHALLYGGFYKQNSEDLETSPAFANSVLNDNSTYEEDNQYNLEPKKSAEITEVEESKGEQEMDMDDLAMLGIDINDVGSGMW